MHMLDAEATAGVSAVLPERVWNAPECCCFGCLEGFSCKDEVELERDRVLDWHSIEK